MKCVILAAGFATRLYPLTLNFPKPLLRIGDRNILEWLLSDLASTGAIDEYVVVSNEKFADQFEAWSSGRSERITVLNDGAESNETRLGAVRDVQFAIDSLGLDDDLLVIAGDNLLDFSLGRFIDYFRAKGGATCIMRYYEPDLSKLRQCGVMEIDETERVVDMTEKPSEPKTHWCSPPFYLYARADVPRVRAGIESGCGVDAPGSFIEWLCKQTTVYAFETPGRRYDIGDIASLEETRAEYRGITK